MWWFETDINSPNLVGDRLRAVACNGEAPAGYAFYCGSWLEPEAACEAFDRMTDTDKAGQLYENTMQPGREALAGLQPARRAP
jgi:hypothetical protein